jgi:predicted N-acetyltransferase YhbS
VTTADIDIALATRDDIKGILDLQERNLADRGGTLSDAYTSERIMTTLAEMPVIVARRSGRVVGYLMSGTRASKQGIAIMEAMLRAYPGRADAYMYGPICVAEDERRRGLTGEMFAALCRQLPGREGVTFIRSDNAVSLRAHAKFGMVAVGQFHHEGVACTILTHPG